MTAKPLLAIDTATEQCSVALQFNNRLYSRAAIIPREHSQRVLEFVEQVLAEASLTLADIGGIVVGAGPGSFTGVRIGVSVAQGLAFSQNIPVYPVTTLAALAQQAIRRHNAKTVVAAIDARMQEVYVASYENINGLAQELSPPKMAPLTALSESEWWPKANSVVGAGTGWTTYGDTLAGATEVTIADDCALPLAEDMLALATKIEPVRAVELEPIYVRNEVTWKKLPGR